MGTPSSFSISTATWSYRATTEHDSRSPKDVALVHRPTRSPLTGTIGWCERDMKRAYRQCGPSSEAASKHLGDGAAAVADQSCGLEERFRQREFFVVEHRSVGRVE